MGVTGEHGHLRKKRGRHCGRVLIPRGQFCILRLWGGHILMLSQRRQEGNASSWLNGNKDKAPPGYKHKHSASFTLPWMVPEPSSGVCCPEPSSSGQSEIPTSQAPAGNMVVGQQVFHVWRVCPLPLGPTAQLVLAACGFFQHEALKGKGGSRSFSPLPFLASLYDSLPFHICPLCPPPLGCLFTFLAPLVPLHIPALLPAWAVFSPFCPPAFSLPSPSIVLRHPSPCLSSPPWFRPQYPLAGQPASCCVAPSWRCVVMTSPQSPWRLATSLRRWQLILCCGEVSHPCLCKSRWEEFWTEKQLQEKGLITLSPSGIFWSNLPPPKGAFHLKNKKGKSGYVSSMHVTSTLGFQRIREKRMFSTQHYIGLFWFCI